MSKTYAPATKELREVSFLKRIRHLRGIGTGTKPVISRLDWTPVEIMEGVGPAAFKRDIQAMKAALEEFDKDLDEHIDGWKREHIEVKKLLNEVQLYLDFWKWLDKEVDGTEKKWEFPSPGWFGWNRKYSRHKVREVLKDLEKKVIQARKVLKREYQQEL